MKVAVVRGKFLNAYEMQFFSPLVHDFELTGFGSMTSYHRSFDFPVIQLPSPMDLPDFPYKMPLLNRLFGDAHVLFGLEGRLRGFDIVHSAETYFYYTAQCLNAKKQGLVGKVIATVLENIPFNNEGIRGRKTMKKRALKELDHIIALTQKTKQALILEGADEKKITIISHFIDTARFVPNKDKQEQLSNPNKINFTILFCGRLEEYKGVFDILQSANRLLHDPKLSEKQINFIFAGKGSAVGKMKKYIYEKDISEYISFISASYDSMPAVYRNADVYLAPSKSTGNWQEQYNTTLLEAQACGLPIITTRSGGIPENVGDAALLINEGDVSALTFSLKSLITNVGLRTDLATKARKRAESVHDVRHGSEKLKKLYLKVISEKK